MTLALSGIGVCCGIAMGKAHLLQGNRLKILHRTIPKDRSEDEVGRFLKALDIARAQLQAIRAQIPRSTPDDIRAFIDTHLLMLEDPSLTEAPMERIRAEGCNAEWALQEQREALVRVFDEMDDPYLRTRKDDVDHVIKRIQRILLRQDMDEQVPGTQNLQGYIILADDLPPADTLWMHHQGVAGFVTEYGGPMSHTTILARSLGIPAIVGVHGLSRYIQEDEELVIDTKEGLVLASIDTSIRQFYAAHRRAYEQKRASLKRLKDEPAVTRDGQRITLLTNIELPEEIAAIREAGASGIGLYRTEFMFMNRSAAPDEEEQFETYLNVVQALEGRALTIRTLDLGAEKEVNATAGIGPITTNPALGLRAIRLCLKEPDLFRPQLRAILRASAYGPVRIMIPMLSHLGEVHQVRRLIHDTQCELDREGEKFDSDILVGGMIEVPAAAVAAPLFAKHLDFLSIGTNDLIQYTLAVDRIDDEVNYLYDPLHPAVLYLIRAVIEAGRQCEIPVSMCGEMAGDPRYTRLLLGMGLEEFSMHPNAVPEIKRIIKASDASTLIKAVSTILATLEPETIRKRVAHMNEGVL